MSTLFTRLREDIFREARSLGQENLRVRGLHKLGLLSQPTSQERTFSYNVLIAQTLGQGACYSDSGIIVNSSLIGKNVLDVCDPEPTVTNIALLDALAGSLPDKYPNASVIVHGNILEKTRTRTTLVINEVLEQTRRLTLSRQPTILNIGAVGEFLAQFKSYDCTVLATDLDESIVGKRLGGVTVKHAEENLELIGQADIILATGMTLATDTLDEILELVRADKKRLIMFAETGANFGSWYCKYGVNVVISEPFPFYILNGSSEMKMYRNE